MDYEEGDIRLSTIVVWLEVPINICSILSTIYIFNHASSFVGSGSSALLRRGLQGGNRKHPTDYYSWLYKNLLKL